MTESILLIQELFKCEKIIKKSCSEYTRASIKLALFFFEKEKVSFSMMSTNRFSFSTLEILKCIDQIYAFYIAEYITYYEQIDENFSSTLSMKNINQYAKQFCRRMIDYSFLCIIFTIYNVCPSEKAYMKSNNYFELKSQLNSIRILQYDRLRNQLY